MASSDKTMRSNVGTEDPILNCPWQPSCIAYSTTIIVTTNAITRERNDVESQFIAMHKTLQDNAPLTLKEVVLEWCASEHNPASRPHLVQDQGDVGLRITHHMTFITHNQVRA